MSVDLSKFNYSLPLQMRWQDLDPLGHVNNAVFVTYFEIGRSLYMPTACPGWDWKNNMFLIANVTADFHKELLLSAKNVHVRIRTSKLGNKSFVLDYVITAGEGDQMVVHASGTTTQIMFDMKARKIIAIPDWVREALQRYDAVD